jgi:plastocyanin
LKKLVVVAGLGALLLSGCKPDAAVQKAEVIGRGSNPGQKAPVIPAYGPAPATVALDPGTLGTASGTVHFRGVAPTPVKMDMSSDPGCVASGGAVFSEQFVVNDGGLGNVFVYVKSGPPAAMATGLSMNQPVVLDQKNCAYVPHVVGVMQGGTVEFRNSDGTGHNIHTMPTVVGNETVNVAQAAKGAPIVKQFRLPELMIPVRCNFHPWMNAFVNVSKTPFFAVTDAKGHFEIAGLPAGVYTLGAVHEKLGEQTLTITVAAKRAAQAEFAFGK